MKPTDQTVVTVFGSADPTEQDILYGTARRLGALLAKEGYAICNGGYGGTMEAVARGAKEAGGSTTGITVESFAKEANRFLDRTIVMPGLIERLLMLMEFGDAYVVLKGGTGTLLELACVWEFVNKGLMPPKPIVTIGDTWDRVIQAVDEQPSSTLHPSPARAVVRVDTVEACLDYLRASLG